MKLPQGHVTDALRDLDKTLALGFQPAAAFNNRGVLRAMMDNLPDRDGHRTSGTSGTNGTNGTHGTDTSDRSHASYGSHGSPATDFDQAIAIGPPRAEAYNNRGVLHTRCGEWEKASADFDEAIRICPDFAPAWANRAIVHARRDQLEVALTSRIIGLPNSAKGPASIALPVLFLTMSTRRKTR